MLTKSRVVAFLTPIFAAGAAAGTPWLVKYTGLKISPADVTALAVTGATAALTPALAWLHGNSLWERAQAEFAAYAPKVAAIDKVVETVDPGITKAVETAAEGEAQKAVEAVVPAAWPVVEQAVADAEVIPLAGPAAPAPAPAPAAPVA